MFQLFLFVNYANCDGDVDDGEVFRANGWNGVKDFHFRSFSHQHHHQLDGNKRHHWTTVRTNLVSVTWGLTQLIQVNRPQGVKIVKYLLFFSGNKINDVMKIWSSFRVLELFWIRVLRTVLKSLVLVLKLYTIWTFTMIDC